MDLITTGLSLYNYRQHVPSVHPVHKRYFPENPNLNLTLTTRDREKYFVNFARTKRYQQSAIPYIQRLLNLDEKEKEQERKQEGEGEGSRREGEEYRREGEDSRREGEV